MPHVQGRCIQGFRVRCHLKRGHLEGGALEQICLKGRDLR